MCSHYNYLGSRCDGGFAEYVAVPEWNLIELPDNVTYEQAAMMEPMAVAVHALRQFDISRNINVCVIGLGTIGLLLTMFLKEMGIKHVSVICNKEKQKVNAMKLGIYEDDIYMVSGNGSNNFMISSGINGNVASDKIIIINMIIYMSVWDVMKQYRQPYSLQHQQHILFWLAIHILI